MNNFSGDFLNNPLQLLNLIHIFIINILLKMRKITKLLFICLILTLVCADICHPQTYLQDVYSASLTAAQKGSNNFALNKSKDSNTYAYTLPRVFSKNPQVAFALTSFDANKKINFAVFISTVQTTPSLINIIINTPWKNTQWSALSFNILLNARTDIQVGSYSFGAQANTKAVSIPFRRALLKTQNYVARAFISGFDLSGKGSTSFSVVGGVISNTHFPIKIKTSQTINVVSISYFLFNPKILGFSAYGGTVNKASLVNVHHQSVFRSIGSLQNYIYGLTGFSFDSNDILINSKIDSRFLLTINPGNGVNSLSFSYIIFGNSPKLACNSCKNTIVNSNIECVASCPVNTALYTFGEGGKACIQCPSEANLVINSKGTDCVCKIGFTLSNGICLKSDSQIITTPDIPVTSHKDSDHVIIVPPRSEFNADQDDAPQPYVAHKCSDPNSFWDGSRCSCLPKYYLVGGICQPCSASTFWNGQTCVSILYGGSQKKRQNRHNGQGSGQGSNSNSPNQPRVVCNGANQYVRADNVCGCLKGFYMNNGVCAVGLQCPQNSVRISPTSCKCNAGYFDNNGYCTKCQKWFYYDQSKNQCQTACPANSVYDATQQNCVCLTGYYKKSTTQCAACPTGSNWVNGNCVTCPIYSTFVNGACKCLTGYTLTNGICRPNSGSSGSTSGSTSGTNLPPGSFYYNGMIVTCPLFTKFDDNLKKCICIPGYTVGSNGICQASCQNGIIQNGVCNFCPINSSPSNGACVCNSGFSKNSAGICVASCNAPYFLYQGNCVSCPISSTWNQNTLTCVCNTGFVKNTYGICVSQCPVGSALINNACGCISGFYSTTSNNAPPCSTCSTGCLSCTNANTCTSCTNGFNLKNGACTPIIICGRHQYLANGVCVNCANDCLYCTGANQCTVCRRGFNWDSVTSSCKSRNNPNPNPNPNPITSTIVMNNNMIKIVYSISRRQTIKTVTTNIPAIKCVDAANTVLCGRSNNLGAVVITATILRGLSGPSETVITNVPAIGNANSIRSRITRPGR